MTKTSKYLTIFGSLLLLIMALFHGSGLLYVKGLMEESNAAHFLKEIVPVLFAHPSIHLLGLAAFGILSLTLKADHNKILATIVVLVLIDSLLAFYLGGVIPGLLLLAAGLSFSLAAWEK